MYSQSYFIIDVYNPNPYFGIKANGVADDTDAFFKCTTEARKYNATIKIMNGSKLRLRNWYLSGNVNIVGDSLLGCEIFLDSDLGLYNSYWANFGIEGPPDLANRKPSMAIPWSGFIKNLTLRFSSSAKAVHLLQIHCANNFEIDNVIFDITNIGNVPTATLASQFDGKWCSGPYTRRFGKITNTIHRMQADSLYGTGGINVLGLEHCLIENNEIYGSGDDPLAILYSKNCLIRNNKCFSTHGRISSASSSNCTFENNYHERIIGIDKKWGNSPLFAAYPENTATYGPPIGTIFRNNRGYLPNGPTGNHTMLDLSGSRFTISDGDIMHSDCETASSVIGVKVGFYHAKNSYGKWTDITGQDKDGISRPRNIIVNKAMCIGNCPGSIEEAGFTANDIIGPVIYRDCIAPKFNIFGLNSKIAK